MKRDGKWLLDRVTDKAKEIVPSHYYSGDQVYSGDQTIATTDEYAEQAAAIATSAPQETPDNAEWLPLGVFALTQDGQASGAQPSLYMQLAISKQG